MQKKFPTIEVPAFEEHYGYIQKNIHPIHTYNLQTRQEIVKGIDYIPTYSQWFSLDVINEIEIQALELAREHPESYMEWRNGIINLYRSSEGDISISSCRKNINCDITNLVRIYTFLEKWSLINIHRKEKIKVNEEKQRNKKNVIFCNSCQDKYEKGKEFVMNIAEDLMFCKKCFNRSLSNKIYETNDFVSYEQKDGMWTDKEELKLLNMIENNLDWDEISNELGKTKEQCVLRFLRINNSKDIDNGMLLDALPNPIMSVIVYLCGSISPQIASESARWALAKVCENKEYKNKKLGMAVLNVAAKKAKDQIKKEEEKLKNLFDLLVELQLRKIEYMMSEFESIKEKMKRERKDLENARKQYKTEYEELKRKRYSS